MVKTNKTEAKTAVWVTFFRTWASRGNGSKARHHPTCFSRGEEEDRSGTYTQGTTPSRIAKQRNTRRHHAPQNMHECPCARSSEQNSNKVTTRCSGAHGQTDGRTNGRSSIPFYFYFHPKFCLSHGKNKNKKQDMERGGRGGGGGKGENRAKGLAAMRWAHAKRLVDSPPPLLSPPPPTPPSVRVFPCPTRSSFLSPSPPPISAQHNNRGNDKLIIIIIIRTKHAP